jgi:hypothetical protein
VGWLCAWSLAATGCLGFGARATRPLADEEAEQVRAWIDEARAEAESRRTIRAYARARITAPEGTTRVREVIAASRNGALRLETLNFLGQTQSLLVTDGTDAAFFDGERITRGDPPDVYLAQLGLDIAPEEIALLLLAAPPLPAEPPARLWAEGETRIADYMRTRLSFGPDGTLRGVTARRGDRSIRYIAEYTQWNEVEGGRYPTTVSLEFPESGLRAELSLEEVELNMDLDESLFEITPARETPGAE